MQTALLHRHNSADYVEKRKKEFKEMKRAHQRSKPIAVRKKELLERLKD